VAGQLGLHVLVGWQESQLKISTMWRSSFEGSSFNTCLIGEAGLGRARLHQADFGTCVSIVDQNDSLFAVIQFDQLDMLIRSCASV
jgi:hypothetical protein